MPLVQTASGDSTGTGATTTAVLTFPSNITAGSGIVVQISWWKAAGGAAISGTADTRGNTYGTAVSAGASNARTAILHTYASTAGANAVTVTFASTVDWEGTAVEWAGMKSSAALDETTSSSGTSTSPVSGTTAATGTNDQVVFVVLNVDSSSTNVGIDLPSGYTNIGINQNSFATIGFSSDYKVVSTTGAQSASWGTLSASEAWIGAIATYELDSGTVNVTGNADMPTVNQVTVETPGASIAPGATDTLDLTVVEQNARGLENATVAVSATPSGVVTLSTPAVTNSSGVTTTTVTGVAPGTAQITATAGGTTSTPVSFTVTSASGGTPIQALNDGDFMFIELSEATAARRRIPFFCFDDDSADAYAVKTGLTFSTSEVKLSKNGAAEVDSGGTVTEVGGGSYYYEATQAELDTVGFLSVRPAKTDVYTRGVMVQVVSFDPYNAATLGMTNFDATITSRLASADYDAPEAALTYASGVETGLTLQGAVRLILAAVAGRRSGINSGTEIFRDYGNTKNRISHTDDGSGNTSSVTYDAS